MSESTLSIELLELRQQVGDYLGWGRSGWDSTTTDKIDSCIQSGLRQFYVPPVIPGSPVHHVWSFLHPTTTLTTVADTADYDMPDDFGNIEGDLTFDPETTTDPVRVVGEGRMRQLRQDLELTGYPKYAAIRWKAATGESGQRQEILLWPTPDDEYTLYYRYAVLAGKLTTSLSYPLGGMLHAETVLASCLAAAEARYNGGRGQKWNEYVERLAASIAMDRKNAPDFFGYNKDASDSRGYSSATCRCNSYTTYNDTLYE